MFYLQLSYVILMQILVLFKGMSSPPPKKMQGLPCLLHLPGYTCHTIINLELMKESRFYCVASFNCTVRELGKNIYPMLVHLWTTQFLHKWFPTLGNYPIDGQLVNIICIIVGLFIVGPTENSQSSDSDVLLTEMY